MEEKEEKSQRFIHGVFPHENFEKEHEEGERGKE